MSMQTTEQMGKVYENINLDYLNMMADGDDEMKKVMLGMLFEEMPLELERMQQECEAGNWTELSAVCHKMKSTLSFVGNPQMTEANQIMEVLSKSGEDINTFPGYITTLQEWWPKVLAELQEVHDSL